MNDIKVCVVGNLGADPELRVTPTGTAIATFRIAHNARRRDADGHWGPGATTWYQIKAFKGLAEHAAHSLKSGQRALVHGRLTMEEWTDGQGEVRKAVRIEADAIGPDLLFGTAAFTNTSRADRFDDAAQEIADRMLRETEEYGRPLTVSREPLTAEADEFADEDEPLDEMGFDVPQDLAGARGR